MHKKGFICALIAVIAFSLQGILAKIAYDHSISYITLLFFRLLVSLPLLLTLTYRNISFQKNIRASLIALVAGMIGHYLAPVLGLNSLNYINANLNGFIISSFPIFVLLINLLAYKKLPTLFQIMGFSLIILGTPMIMGVFDSIDGVQSSYGFFLALFSAIAFAFYIFISQNLMKKMSPLVFVALGMIGGSIPSFIHFLVSLEVVIVSSTGLLVIITSALLQVITLYLLALATKLIGGNRVAITSALDPLFVSIFAYIILGEYLSLLQIIGGGLIIFAVLVSELSGVRRNHVL